MKKSLLTAAVTLLTTGDLLVGASTNAVFTGRIEATLTRGGDAQKLLYTAGTNCLRIEPEADGRPNPVDLLDRNSGELTLLFPNNRSFVRLKKVAATPPSPNAAAAPPPHAMPPGVGPQGALPPQPPARIGPTNLPGQPAMPPMPQMPQRPQMPPGAGPGSGAMPMPMMPPMMMEPAEFKATGETTNLLGYACAKYEIKQRGEVMEIWAADKLMPFQAYQQNQPHRFGPRMLEEQWGELVKAKKLFPLLAVLRFEHGPERLRFEVKLVKPEEIEDKGGALFAPPADYHELEALPF